MRYFRKCLIQYTKLPLAPLAECFSRSRLEPVCKWLSICYCFPNMTAEINWDLSFFIFQFLSRTGNAVRGQATGERFYVSSFASAPHQNTLILIYFPSK